jgi:hypothetical protein
MCVLMIPTAFPRNISHSKNSAMYNLKKRYAFKVPVILVRYLTKIELSPQIF